MMARPALRPRLAAAFLREGRTVEMPLGGSSMRPLFAPGDTLRIHPASVADLRPGDVIIIDLGEHLLCHRLVYMAGDQFVSRGDDSPEHDPALPIDAIVGRVDVPASPHALYCAVRALLR